MDRLIVGRQILRHIGLGTLVLVFTCGAAHAQVTTNTSGIEGTVADSTSGVLPGVTVSISSPALLAPQLDVVTDENGRYRFASLPGGVYRLTFALPGFQTVTREGLTIAAGFTATVDTSMSIGALAENVTVVGASPMVDVRNAVVVTTIDRDVLKSLPMSRGIEDMGKLAPGVSVSGISDVGGNKTGGARGSLVSYGSNAGGSTLMVDGVNTDGTSGYFDAGAIESVTVSASANNPEIATPGMALQIVIKSGGNDFHGEVVSQFQTRAMQDNNIDDRLRRLGVSHGTSMDHYYDNNFTLGGRIVRDRLWFFGSARKRAYQQQPIGFLGEPGLDGTYYTVDDVQGHAAELEDAVVTKFTGRLTDKQNLSYSRHYILQRKPYFGYGAFRPNETTFDYSLKSPTWTTEWTDALTNHSFIRLAVGRSSWFTSSVPKTDTPSQFDNITLRNLGAGVNSVGLDSAPAGSHSTRMQVDGSYSYFRSSLFGMEHEIKVGAGWHREWYNKWQELRSVGRGGTGHDYQLIFSGNQPFEVRLANSPYNSKNYVDEHSAFVRDTMRIGSRVTVDLGLRVERYNAFLPPQDKPAGPFSSAAHYDQLDLYDWRGISPRLGVAYVLTSDNKTVVKMTYGRFNFAVRASDSRVVRNFNKNDWVGLYHTWNDLNGNRDFDHPAELGSFLRSDGAASTVFNPIEQPNADELNVFLEREIAPNFSSRMGYVYKRLGNQFQLVNTARPFSAYNLPTTVIDPGSDLRSGTADDGGGLTYYDFDPALRGPAFERGTYVNLPGYDDTYHNIEFAVDKRLSQRWQFSAAFLGTKRDVWINGVPYTPNDEFFPKDQTWTTTFRASGYYEVGWGIRAASVYERVSGTPLARSVLFRTGLSQLGSLTLRMEPLGSIQLPAVTLLSLRASKRVALGRHSLTFSADVMNALNQNATTAMTVASGPAFGRITAIVPPRVARVGVNYDF